MKSTYPAIYLLTILLSSSFYCSAKPLTEIDSAKIRKDFWKTELQNHKYTVTKNRSKIPPEILKQIDVDTVTEVTRWSMKWAASCASGEPSVKLNWAAHNKAYWIICYSTGGYHLRTSYQFISPNTDLSQETDNLGYKHFRFKKFKRRFLSDTLEDSKVIRARF